MAFLLSVFPLFFSCPYFILFCIKFPTSLRAARRLVCSFFSFVTPLFQKASLIETERNKKGKKKEKKQEKKNDILKERRGRSDVKWFSFPKKMKRVDFSKAAAMMKWSAYAAECIDCIVRPCVQNPWYCLHSPINVFCMVWSCCHGDPRIGRLKGGDVCMEGAREKEKGAPLACVLTDGLTREHGTVCVHAYWCARVVILLNLLPCHVPLLLSRLPFVIIMCSVVSQLPCHPLQPCTCCTWVESVAPAVMLVHALLLWSHTCCAGL